jgi:hypothetical protein
MLKKFKRKNLLKCSDIGSRKTHFGLPRVNSCTIKISIKQFCFIYPVHLHVLCFSQEIERYFLLQPYLMVSVTKTIHVHCEVRN